MTHTLIGKDLRETPATNFALWQLEQRTAAILDEAVRLHNPVQIAFLMSGGHDSVAATAVSAQWATERKLPYTVLHLDTGIGIAQTQDYVKAVCAEQAWDLQIYRAREHIRANGSPDPMCYERLVRYHGFPSDASHGIMYSRLKERSLHRFVRSVKKRRSDRVMFVSGVRKSESKPRMRRVSAEGSITQHGVEVWVDAIADWSGVNCFDFMRRHSLPKNEVKQLLGISGECLCGAHGSKAEWEVISSLFPADPSVILINQLHEEVQHLGFPWGWGDEVPEHWLSTHKHTELYQRWRKTVAPQKSTGKLCHNCNQKGACTALHSQAVTDAIERPGFVFSSELTSNALSEPPIHTMHDNAMQPDQALAPFITAMMGSVFNTNHVGPRLFVTRGQQAGRFFYNATIPYGALTNYLKFEEHDLPDDLRAQRPFNDKKAQSVAKYMVENPDDYGFGSLVGIINPLDADFIPLFPGGDAGFLQFKHPDAKAIADGQHRNGGILLAIQDGQFLDESIGVVFFLRETLEQRRHLFASLNRYGTKPSNSTNEFYDYADPDSDRARKIMEGVLEFKILTDLFHSTARKGSIKLFSFHSLYTANSDLFRGSSLPDSEQIRLGIAFWTAVAAAIPHWRQVANLESSPDEVRKNYIHHLQITLQAIARVGSRVIEDDFQACIAKLAAIDWTRQNSEWQGIFIFDGKIRKDQKCVSAFAHYLALKLGVED